MVCYPVLIWDQSRVKIKLPTLRPSPVFCLQFIASLCSELHPESVGTSQHWLINLLQMSFESNNSYRCLTGNNRIAKSAIFGRFAHDQFSALTSRFQMIIEISEAVKLELSKPPDRGFFRQETATIPSENMFDDAW